MSIEALIRRIPKVELHVHLEGTLEPENAFAIGFRNGLPLPYATPEAMREAYRFSDLESFLDVYYEACSVLLTEHDFFEMTMAFMRRAHADNVRHVEPFFDPQTHTMRGVPFKVAAGGIRHALNEAHTQFGITSALIMCIRRELEVSDAAHTLEEAIASGLVDGVGLDSSETGYPPGRFAMVFARARDAGLRVVAHAGEEGPASYIAEAVDILHAERVDHGVRVLEDPELTARLAHGRICFTVCPSSNVSLRVVETLEQHPLVRMLDAGIHATVNSDDPAYFGGYLQDVFLSTAEALSLSREQVLVLARNAIEGSFATFTRKEELRAELALAAE